MWYTATQKVCVQRENSSNKGHHEPATQEGSIGVPICLDLDLTSKKNSEPLLGTKLPLPSSQEVLICFHSQTPVSQGLEVGQGYSCSLLICPPTLSVLKVFPLQHRRVHTGELSWVSCRGGPASPEGLTYPTGAGLTLSLRYVSKTLFHPVLDCCFPWWLQFQDATGRSPPLGLRTDVWYSAPHSTSTICRTSPSYHPSMSLDMQLPVTPCLHLCPMTVCSHGSQGTPWMFIRLCHHSAQKQLPILLRVIAGATCCFYAFIFHHPRIGSLCTSHIDLPAVCWMHKAWLSLKAFALPIPLPEILFLQIPSQCGPSILSGLCLYATWLPIKSSHTLYCHPCSEDEILWGRLCLEDWEQTVPGMHLVSCSYLWYEWSLSS